MGITNLFRPSRSSESVVPWKSLAAQATHQELAEVLHDYDLVKVVENSGDPFIVVTTKLADTNPGNYSRDLAMLGEIGSASPSPFTSWARAEYNRDLIGLAGLRMYDRMRRSDGVVRGTLRAVKTPVLGARWFVKPDSDSTRDKNAAQFVSDCLFKYMSVSWPQLLTESLLMLDFGYYMFEKVWEPRVIAGKERLVVKKLAPRHPMDVKMWYYDNHGGPLSVCFYPDNINTFNLDEPMIPIDKLLVFSFDKEAGNIEGISVLRSAYKHWYFKEQLYKIDAIQKERHGIGIPVIALPINYSIDDVAKAEDLGRNLRSNERAHVVLPPNWQLMFAELKGQKVDALASIAVHDDAIRQNVMASFLGEKTTTKEEDQTMFLKATRFIADIVMNTINQYLIPQLVGYNYTNVGMPMLQARRIGEQEDWRTMSFSIRNYVGAGVIRPDDPLEEYIRNEMDLPPVDEATVRLTGNVRETVSGVPDASGAEAIAPPDMNAPGAPAAPKAGLPRQQPVPPKGTPRGNAGRDGSGG